MPAPVQEQVEQKQGAHAWMVAIGAVCLLVAIIVGVLGRFSGSIVEKAGDKTTTKSWPSETLITSLLAVGAVLVVVGFLWARITSIKVAGAEIGLSDDEKQKVSNAITKSMPEKAAPQEAAQAALSVATALAEQKAAGAPLTDDAISEVVAQHTQNL